jgi:hypothetical protein
MDDDLVALNNHFGGSAADDIGKLTFGFLVDYAARPSESLFKNQFY